MPGVGPVAIYLCLLGTIGLSRRPLLVSGVRDAATLALALSGLVVIGPMELFFPFAAAGRFGSHVWLLLLSLYVMCVILWLLMLRPRLVIYNISADKLRPILAEAVNSLDAEARWAGESLALPALGVQLYVNGFAALRGGIVDRRRRQPEPGRLAAVGGGARRRPFAGGSCPQSTRLAAPCCRPVVRLGHVWTHLPRIPRRLPARCWTLSSRCSGWWGCDASN